MILEAIEKAGYKPGKDICARARRRRRASSSTRSSKTYNLEGESKELDATRHGRLLRASWAEQYPIVSIEDGLAEDDWDGWKQLTEGARRQGPARRRRPVRHQHRAPQAAASRRASPTDPRQGEPDRHADRDARRRSSTAHRARLDRDHLAPLGRDRGHVHRRPRRRHQRRPDQDRLARALGSRREVQPAAPHRGGAGRDRHLGRLARPALEPNPLPPRTRGEGKENRRGRRVGRPETHRPGGATS